MDIGEFSPAGEDTAAATDAIGAVAVAPGLQLSTEDADTRVTAYISADARDEVRLGQYLLVPYPDADLLFTRVTALEYAAEFDLDDATEIQTRRALSSDTFDERAYKLLVRMDPLGILSRDGDGYTRRASDRLPKPGAAVRVAADPAEIKSGLAIPTGGLFLGHVAVNGRVIETGAHPTPIDYRLRDGDTPGDPLIFRHLLIAGGTGAGKTHMAKNILRQLLAPERRYTLGDGRQLAPAVVQFDPQDEYAQMAHDNAAIDADWQTRLEAMDVASGGVPDTLALVPRFGDTTYAPSGHTAETLAFTIPFSLTRQRPYLIAGGDLNEQQYHALRSLLRRFFASTEAPTFTAFLAHLRAEETRATAIERDRIHEATYDAVVRRVRAVPRDIFDQPAPSLPEVDHRLVRSGGLTVIPTYHLPDSRVRSIVVLAVSGFLIDSKLSTSPISPRVKETPLIIGMDEAHNFLADAEGAQAQQVIATFTEAAKQGRKERLGLFLITQDPQDIAPGIFKQINTRCVLNLVDRAAIERVNVPAALRWAVPYLGRGEMIVHSPDNSEAVQVTGLPVALTRHGR